MKVNHREAFTMVELVFVMVVLGIISMVAIPILAGNRDDANAAKCTHEFQQLITEISLKYANEGYSSFLQIPISEITNLNTGITEEDGVSSLSSTVVSSGIVYMCDGKNIAEIKGASLGSDYNLTVRDLDTQDLTPASMIAMGIIRELNDIDSAGGSKMYRL